MVRAKRYIKKITGQQLIISIYNNYNYKYIIIIIISIIYAYTNK